MNMDEKVEQIRTLIDLMQENDLATLEVISGDQSISLSRQPSHGLPSTPPTGTALESTPPSTLGGTTEDSPMVGVFYVAPSPNDAPFVVAGQKVQAGDTLGIIEAMKIMNPLEATQSGIIDEVLIQDGEVVQFGQPIVRYKP